MMNVILSTRNPSKAEQIKEVFSGLPISVLTLSDAAIEGDAVEDGKTLQENALKKALFAYNGLTEKTWTMADDTGLFIDALNGEPGIRAARWAGETATTHEILQYTLRKLEGVKSRLATFETLVALISPRGEQHFFSGKVNGHLLDSPRVEPQPKMPYSAIFIPEGDSRVWAQMTPAQENEISHRGKAFKQVREFLEKQYR